MLFNVCVDCDAGLLSHFSNGSREERSHQRKHDSKTQRKRVLGASRARRVGRLCRRRTRRRNRRLKDAAIGVVVIVMIVIVSVIIVVTLVARSQCLNEFSAKKMNP